MRKSYKGFTLTELIITIALLLIMAVVAVPTYTKYVLKSKVAELWEASIIAQMGVATHFVDEGSLTSADFSSGGGYTATQSDRIDSISITDGVITVDGKAAELGGLDIKLVIVPTASTTRKITWTCYTSIAFYDYMPSNCKNCDASYGLTC